MRTEETINEFKKEIKETTLPAFFAEINDQVTRNKIKQKVEMVVNKYTLGEAKVICDTSNNTEKTAMNYQVCVDVEFIDPDLSLNFIYGPSN